MTFGDQMMFWPDDRPKVAPKTGPAMSKTGKVVLGAIITLTAFGGLVSLYDAGKEAGRRQR